MTINANNYGNEYPTCSETYATLRIWHPDLSPHEISADLDLDPTFSYKKGDMRKRSRKPAPHGMWGLSSKDNIVSLDSRRHVDWVINQVWSKRSHFKRYQDLGYEMDVLCYWLTAGYSGGPEVSLQNMTSLVELGLVLWFDIYCDRDESKS